jgi:nucleolar complex protein 3
VSEPDRTDEQNKKPAKETETGPTGKPKRRPDQPKKIKLRDQKFIPVPKTAFAGREENGADDEDEDEDFDDEDLGVEEGLDMEAVGRFARGLDSAGLSR